MKLSDHCVAVEDCVNIIDIETLFSTCLAASVTRRGPVVVCCFIAFLSLYIVLIDVLIYSAAQLQECLITLLTYLLTLLVNKRTA